MSIPALPYAPPMHQIAAGAWMWCADCRSDQLFEQPPCPDGHAGDCPEWMCSLCGSAHIDVYPLDPVTLG